MKTYTITEDTLNAVIDMFYSWCNTAIVYTDNGKDIRIVSPEDAEHFADVSDLVGNIANNTAITLDMLLNQ